METVSKSLGHESSIDIINFEIKGDERGSLISLENYASIPFEIKRVYYIFGTKPEVTRGKHAHKELKQVLICTSGSCKVLIDDGKEKKYVLLDRPDIGLYISGLVWREMSDFSSDCTLMVLASNIYLESDYIRDFKQFIDLARDKNNE